MIERPKSSLKTEDTIILNERPVRLYIQEHLTENELNALVPVKELPKYEKVLKIPFKMIQNFASSNKKVDGDISKYIKLLSFCQRVRIPKEIVFENYFIHRYEDLDIFDELNGFQTMNKFIKQHYEDCFKAQGNDEALYERDVKAIKRLVYRLWCSGYGLLEGEGYEPITNELLHEVYELQPLIAKPKLCYFLSYCLSKETKSPVKEIIRFSKTKSKIELEEEHWEKAIEMLEELKLETELLDEFHSFVFESLYERTKKDYIQSYTDVEGNVRNVTYDQISVATWRKYSRCLRNFITHYCVENDCLSIGNVLNGKALEVFSVLIDDYQKSSLGDYVAALSNWYQYYSRENQISIQANKVIPSAKMGRKTTKYGKQIDFRKAVKLIEVLLDDQSPHHNDNQLMHFRGRRICLLQLETGKRIHEILLLKKNCLVKNRYNEVFIEFHKTKTGKKSRIKLSKEGLKWVEQLQYLAPDQPIEANTEIYTYGDDLNVERLVATSSNDGIYDPSVAYYYLVELQKKIFGHDVEGGYFGTHDLRRMCATYMKIKGFSDEEIAEKLGHSDLKSQINYTLTISNETMEKISDLAEKGLYGLSDTELKNESNEVILSSDSILKTTSMLVDTVEDEELAKSFIEKLFQEVENVEIPQTSYLPDGEIPTGFPMRTNNCNAHAKVTCFHHTLKCYKCSQYSPDNDMLNEHKAELVRWTVFLHYNETLLKKSKDKLEKAVLPAKIEDIKKDLNETFIQLFIKFPGIDKEGASKLEKEVQSLAQKYIKKYFKKNPNPTVDQMNQFIQKGVI